MPTPRSNTPGPERFILALVLFVPLGMMVVMLGQIAGPGGGAPSSSSSVAYADANDRLTPGRPASSYPAPPPTLSPPYGSLTFAGMSIKPGLHLNGSVWIHRMKRGGSGDVCSLTITSSLHNLRELCSRRTKVRTWPLKRKPANRSTV
jgi:hypothetical protein